MSDRQNTDLDATSNCPESRSRRHSRRRYFIGIGIWSVVQVVIAVAVPAIFGRKYSFDGLLFPLLEDWSDVEWATFYSVASTVSVLVSWLLLSVILRLRIGIPTALLFCGSLAIVWIADPVWFVGTPVFVDQALTYYLFLAAACLCVFGFHFLKRIPGWLSRHMEYQIERLIDSRIETSATAPYQDEANDNSGEKQTPSRNISDDLRDRARAYRNDSRWSLGAIFAALAGGAVVFVGADMIAVRDFEQRLISIHSDLRRAQEGLIELNDTLHEMPQITPSDEYNEFVVGALEEYEMDLVEGLGFIDSHQLASGNKESLDEIRLRFAEKFRRVIFASQDSVDAIDRTLRRYEYRFANVGTSGPESRSPTLERLENLAIESENDSALRTILSSLTTRIGSVLLIIFLVKILTTIYRYSARMAARNDSLANIFSLGDISQKDTIELLSRDDVHFDRVPKDPTSDIKEVVLRTIGTG